MSELMVRIQSDIRNWVDANFNAAPSHYLYLALTPDMLNDIMNGVYVKGDTRILGMRVEEAQEEATTGLFVAGINKRVGGPYQRDGTPVDGNTRFGHLSEEQIAELTAWFESLSDNDPDRVMRAPEFYAASIAWTQLHGLEMIDSGSDLRPWNMPRGMAQYYADVWYANRLAILRVHRRRTLGALEEAANGGNGAGNGTS